MEPDENGKLIYYLQMLNDNWKRYGNLVQGRTDLVMGEHRAAVHVAEVKYAYAELRLAELGWRWDQLAYDRETKTYSFPETKSE